MSTAAAAPLWSRYHDALAAQQVPLLRGQVPPPALRVLLGIDAPKDA